MSVTRYKAWLNVKPPFSVKSFPWSVCYYPDEDRDGSQNVGLFTFKPCDTGGILRVLLHSVAVKV